jgi:hypothetical protein
MSDFPGHRAAAHDGMKSNLEHGQSPIGWTSCAEPHEPWWEIMEKVMSWRNGHGTASYVWDIHTIHTCIHTWPCGCTSSNCLMPEAYDALICSRSRERYIESYSCMQVCDGANRLWERERKRERVSPTIPMERTGRFANSMDSSIISFFAHYNMGRGIAVVHVQSNNRYP